jgi:hypothetical protein
MAPELGDPGKESVEFMQKPDRSSYTPLDFLSWRELKSFVLVPKFQRRGVWPAPARSFLIDTLLQGFPVPPIYLRTAQSEDKKRTVREVIDGQQRLSAVLDYMDGKYTLSKVVGGPQVGKMFSDLTENDQNLIRTYGFICETLHGASDQEVLEIFARLNTYSVPLNAQELRNGKYFGRFKQTAYRLAHEHIEFWRRHRIFSERSIARMLEVELTSEVMILQLDGLQDKKGSINAFYAEYDEDFPDEKTVEKRFRSVIDAISTAAGDVLADSEFKRPPLFYSLFGAAYHRLFGLPNLKLSTPKKALTQKESSDLASAVTTLSDMIAAASEGQPVPRGYGQFIVACQRQTDNLGPRSVRLEKVYTTAF